jgi:hypothetical protein
LLLVLTGMKQDRSYYSYDYNERRKVDSDRAPRKKDRRAASGPTTVAPARLAAPPSPNTAPSAPKSSPLLSNGALSKLDMDSIDELLRDYTKRPEQN